MDYKPHKKGFMEEIGSDLIFKEWRFEYVEEQREAFQAGLHSQAKSEKMK